jgi:putative oxidoreductase
MTISSLLSSLETLTLRLVPSAIASLALRFGLATPFFKSGLTKWDGFLTLSDTPLILFENEFKLHVFGKVFDYPFPLLAAWGSSIAEIVLPILLVIGLGTRFAAFALLVMTALIQLTIPDGWPIHITWAAMAAGLIVLGAGRLSLDSVLRRG